MDDFRVGSIPSSEPYGDRHTYDGIARKRHKHHDDGHAGEQDQPSDTFEVTSETASEEAPDSPAAASDNVEDYYLPAEPAESE